MTTAVPYSYQAPTTLAPLLQTLTNIYRHLTKTYKHLVSLTTCCCHHVLTNNTVHSNVTINRVTSQPPKNSLATQPMFRRILELVYENLLLGTSLAAIATCSMGIALAPVASYYLYIFLLGVRMTVGILITASAATFSLAMLGMALRTTYELHQLLQKKKQLKANNHNEYEHLIPQNNKHPINAVHH